MIYPSIDKIIGQVGSKYLLINVISQRVKEMKNKKYYQMNDRDYKSSKDIGKALEEISNNLIIIKE